MARRRRKGKRGKWLGHLLSAVLALPALYLMAALVGSLIPANHSWSEPRRGTTIFIADNGIHSDLILPVRAEGLDWSRELPRRDFADVPPSANWIAFGSGERDVYLETPSWWDIRLRTILAALVGGPRVMHVEYVPDPNYAARRIVLRPLEYRRLWATIRSDFVRDDHGRPRRIKHAGYGPSDGFYVATGEANALRPCNVVVARWLRLAGVKASIWPPFTPGLLWRYRKVPNRRDRGEIQKGEPAQST